MIVLRGRLVTRERGTAEKSSRNILLDEGWRFVTLSESCARATRSERGAGSSRQGVTSVISSQSSDHNIFNLVDKADRLLA